MNLYVRLMMKLHGMSQWSPEYIASKDFLNSPEWRRCRYDALEKNDGRCELCGRNKHQLEPGEYLNVDHVRCRRDFPWLALNRRFLQVLCGPCNAGKGNRSKRDWRKKDHTEGR